VTVATDLQIVSLAEKRRFEEAGHGEVTNSWTRLGQNQVTGFIRCRPPFSAKISFAPQGSSITVRAERLLIQHV
jgi:hypothetical protein